MSVRRIPRVRQHDETDCGAACLDSVARYYGRRVPIARIRQIAGTDRGGTSLRGLIEAAEHIGLGATGVRAPMEALPAIPLPAIAHIRMDSGRLHYLVLWRVVGSTVTVMDPADGELRRESVAEFCRTWTGVVLLLAPRDVVATGEARTLPPVLRLWRIASPHWRTMLQAAAGALAYTALGLAIAVFVQKIVDFVLPGGGRDLLDLMAVTMLVLVVVQVYLRAARDLLVLRTGQRIDGALLMGYYEHLLRLPQRFFDTMRVGEIVSRLNDAVKIRVFINEVSLELLVNALVVVSSLALMLVYSPPLTALMCTAVPLYLLIYWATNRAHRRDQRQVMEAAAEMEAHVVESVGAATLLRRLQLEEHSGREAEARLVGLLGPIYSVGRTSLASGAAAECVSRLATVGLLWFGAVLVLRQQMSAGELMSFYALNGHLTTPVLGLIAASRQVQDALVAADRLFEILDLEQDLDPGSVEFPLTGIDSIRFRDVHFRYGSRPPVFKGLDLTITMGALTAIVGESGSGKSTLAALAQRLYLPHQGRILFGRVEIRHIRRASLLQAVAVVPQEASLLSGTLLENLVPGVAAPDLDRLAGILDSIGLSETIESLPAGLATPVGERGLALSGGQRQRAAIARALYRRPRILILDEATSGLDSQSEMRVLTALRDLQRRGTTVIVITHRLSSARHADRILVLREGALVEAGTHLELMEVPGVYHALWQSQTDPGTVTLEGNGCHSAALPVVSADPAWS